MDFRLQRIVHMHHRQDELVGVLGHIAAVRPRWVRRAGRIVLGDITVRRVPRSNEEICRTDRMLSEVKLDHDSTALVDGDLEVGRQLCLRQIWQQDRTDEGKSDHQARSYS